MEIPDGPLQTHWAPISMVEVPQEMVIAIAMGLEEPEAIASRHGFEGEKWVQLQRWKPFLDTVAAQRAEFEKSGLTFRLKAALKADLIAEKVFVEAMGNDVTFVQRLEALRTFAKLGNLEPKEEKTQQQGTTFAISIDLGDRSVALTAPMAEEVAQPAKKTPMAIADVVDVDVVDLGLMKTNPFAVTGD